GWANLSGAVLGLIAVGLVLLMAGCGAPATIQRFETFATTGSTYTQAVGALIDDTSDLLIDADSAKLLENRQRAPVSPGDFKEQDDAMRQRVRDLRLLKRQLDLLGQYFEALGSFAAKDESQRIAGELDDLGNALSDVANALDKGNTLIRDGELVGRIASKVGTTVAKGGHARRLRQELEDRGELIAKVLSQQSDLLKNLAQQAEEAQSTLMGRDYRDSVVRPFLSADPIPEDDWEEWMNTRRSALSQAPVPDSLSQAFDAAVSLRAAWTGLLANELGEDQLQEVASQVAPLAASAPAD
ncbi:MAG TPA: hypothetical protein VIW92_07070, partial [Thermoanaerobaculia bacterium]